MQFIIPLIMLAVSMLLSMLLVKRQTPKPASLEEWEFPQWKEGTPQTIVFGDVWIPGQVVWYGNYRTSKIKSGGKK